MKFRKFTYFLMAVLVATTVYASTTTTNYSLSKPAEGDTDWEAEINANWDTIDTQMKANADDIDTNDTATALNTTHRGSNGTDHANVGTNTTAIGLNTTHRGDNTQAHSDYLLNNANDSTSGVITSTGFTIGSAAILEAELEILDGATLGTADINIIDGISDSGSLTAAELLYVDGVTSGIQAQIDAIDGGSGSGATSLTGLTDVSSATVTGGFLLVADGTDWESIAVSGDTTIDKDGVTYIGGNKVQLAELDVSDVSDNIAGDIAEGELADSIVISADIKNGTVVGDDLANFGTLTGTLGNILIADGTDFETQTMSGDVTINAAGATAVQANAVALTTDTTGNYAASDAEAGPATSLTTDSLDALTEIAAALKSGADATLVTGTKGTSGYCAEWNADGDLVEAASGAACGSGGAGASSLTGLSDVNTATVTAGNRLIADGTDWESVSVDGSVTFVFDGGGSAVAADSQAWTEALSAFTINEVTVSADTTGNTTVDIWKSTTYPPTNSDSICASDCPALAGSNISVDTTLGTWTTTVAKGDYVKAYVDSAATLTQSVIILKGPKQ